MADTSRATPANLLIHLDRTLASTCQDARNAGIWADGWAPARASSLSRDTLAADKIEADYDAGVLTIRIPVAEHAKPRKIEIKSSGEKKEIIS